MMNEIMTQDREIREKVRAVFLATLMVVSVFGGSIALAGSAAASSHTVVVDGDGDGDYTSIQGAIDGEGANSTIIVEENSSGSYSSFSTNADNVTVEAADGAKPTINATSRINLKEANEATLSGFEINLKTGGDGLYTKGDDVVIRDNDITVFTGTDPAIRIGDASNPQITGNDFMMKSAPSGANVQAILLSSTTGADVSNNRFDGNTSGDGTFYTIQVSNNAGNTSEVSITGNEITGTDYGISLYENADQIKGVTVENNTVSDATAVDIIASDPDGKEGFSSINGESTDSTQLVSLYESNSGIVNVTVNTQSRTDEAGGPNVTDATVLDRDQDGDIDAVDVTLSEPVNDGTLAASDFALGGVGADARTPDNVSTGANAYDAQFTLTFDDDNEIDGTEGRLNAAMTGTVEDLAGNALDSFNESNVTDGAKPVVEEVSFDPSVVNASNTINGEIPVTVTATFSEQIDSAPTTFQLDGVTVGTDVTVDGNSVTGTTDGNFGASGTDKSVNTTISGASDGPNSQVAFDQENYEIDVVPPRLSTNTVTTLDSDDDGTVDQLEVEFADNLADDTVDASDFEVTNPAATIDGWYTGTTENDDIIVLNVSGLPEGDTSVTPDVTVFEQQIEDTAGNAGPYGGDQTQTAEDGASPIVTSISVNESVLNASDVPTNVEVNATFSENVTGNPSVELLGLGQGDLTTTIAASGSDNLTATSDSEIVDSDEDVSVRVNVSGGDDGAGNAVETFNSTTFDGETLLTVDTNEPTVSVNTSELPSEPVAGEIDLSSYFDISGAESDGGDTTYLINTTGATGGEFMEVSASFDTTTIDDTDGLIVRAVSTDDVDNEVLDTFTAAQSINVDNTAPTVTIDSPSETTAEPSNGTLPLEWTVDEQNIDGNATIVLEGDNNTIQYNASVSDGSGNTVDLRLNTSENASAGDGRLPNLNQTNGSFDTQTLYDLSVTVDDTTGKSTTATLDNALFLDDTKPANFSLLEPSDATEYEAGDEFQIAYGYTEDNTDTVTVSLTNESGKVANMTVDESQYVDDGVIKSFEANLYDSFDTDSLADGRYNVTVTVTDLAGNELVDSTSNAPIAINEDSPKAVPSFNEGPNATASINESENQVTVDVTYNVSVPDVEDAGNIDDSGTSLDKVNVSSTDDDLVTLSVDYYDESEDEYVKHEEVTVSIDEFTDSDAVENESITETITFDIADLEGYTDLADEDRILDYTVDITGDFTVEAWSSTDDSTAVDDGVDASDTFVSQEKVVPSIESVEVDGVDTPSDSLTISFDRPVEETGTLISDDFGYQDVSGDGANYVTDVSGVDDNDTMITIALAEDVNATDVGSDIVSIQPDVLENADSGENVSAVNGTIVETTPPAFTTDEVDVGSNTSTITVTFDQPVVAGDDGALTAANFTFTGATNVTSVDHSAEDSSATLILNGEVTSEEAGSANVTVADEEVFDRFGNSQSDKITVVDSTDPSDIEIVDPSEQVIKQSDDLLDMTYSYTENVPDNVESVTITLDGPEERSYEIDDTQYTENNKSLSIDLDDGGNLTDGAYDLTIEATDASDNTHSVTENGLVVINDDAPSVSDVTITNDRHDIAPDATLNLTYDYEPAPNATGATVWLVNSEDVSNFTAADLDNTTYTTYDVDADHGVVDDREVSIDLAGEIADNEDYEVFVTATDVSGLTSDAAQAGHNVDVNEYAPAITQVEANAGSSEVYVHFNESVVAGDGDDELDASDFAYEDVGGTSSITSVERVDDDTVMLVLSDAVSADDLGTDHVSARSGQIVDTDGANARTVDTNAVALSDTTAPSVEILSAGSINADNADSYQVTLDTTSEVTDVTMTLTGPNGTEVSASETGVTGQVTLTFNASALEDGTVAHEVTVTDMGGNNASASGTLTKDTDRPDIVSVETDPESSIVTVTFNESMAGVTADDFTMVGTDLTVEEVDQYDDDYVELVLNGTVPVDAINNSEVMVSTTAEDLAGSAADDSAKLMDTFGPYIQSVDAEEGSSTVNVTVNEPVSDSENVTADAFDYLDANGDGEEIVNVTTLSPTKFQLEFNDSVTTADLVNDEIALTENATDLLGNEATGDWYVSLDYSDYPALSASADGSTVTLTLETAANLSADGTSLTVDLEERDSLRTTTGEYDEPFSTELNASDFTETADGVYEATVEVPDDGIYMADGGLATDNGDSNAGLSATVEVDTQAPDVSDAVLSGISTTDFENDGEPDSTLVVTFSEAVDASEISADDVSIEGHDGEVVAVTSAGSFGYIEITVEGTVQTGTSPEVSIDSSSYTELAGDGSTGVEDSATVLHTAKLDLSEGTNFVSVPAAAGELDLDEMDLSNVDVIYSYDAADDSWDAFDPDAKENDFDELHGGQGYIFEMDDEDTLDVNVYNEPLVTGDVAVPSEQQLTEGWNLVGHYQEFDQNAYTAFSSVSDSVYAVYGQNEASAAQSYEAVAMDDDLEPGEAYWVFVTDDEVYAEASAHQTPK